MILLLMALGTAQAGITADRTGGYVDVTGGFGLADGPALATHLSFGAWRGKYDEDLSFGRYWGGGLTLRQDWAGNGVRTAYMLEARRGMDLVVVGVHGFVAGGALLVQPGVGLGDVGGTARLGGAAEFRRSRTLGVALRLEAGVDAVNGRITPAGAVTLGVQSQLAGRR